MLIVLACVCIMQMSLEGTDNASGSPPVISWYLAFRKGLRMAGLVLKIPEGESTVLNTAISDRSHYGQH